MSFDPKILDIKKICESLTGFKANIGFTGTLNSGENLSGEINNCNIIGNCMEDILYPIIEKSIPTFEKGPPGQKPDFINLVSKLLSYDYELKCFNIESGAGFDIGSITGFLEDISKPAGVQKKLDVKYLIFEYEIDKKTKGFTITKFWMLSVYDICCGYGGQKPINIGGQKGVNIRPATKNQWTDEKNRDKRNPTNFLDRIEELIKSKWYNVDELEKQQKLESIQTQRKAIGF
tara:strand:+ start:396 stop:1094 length:699 start_codon:yes stop_codon:yes gene_type:complete